jgi:phasin family protein
MMATGAETLKATAEKYTAASSAAFKDAVDKSLAALNEMNTHSKANLEAVVASVTAATKGAEALGAQVTAYSKKAAEDHIAATKTLTGAKSLQEAVEFQTAYAKSFLDSYLAEMNRWSDTVSGSVKESLRPINERVSAVVEQFQTAR